jgi:hypothetical protein
MSGQHPWQGPSPSTERPRQPGQEKPEKKSGSAFREWISTTAGVTSAIVALVGLLVGGTAAGVKIFTPSPAPSPSITPTPTPTFSNSPTPSPTNLPHVNLQNALLFSGALGPAATVQSSGTDLSQIGEICGAPVSGDTNTAYETIQDQQSGTFLTEALVEWRSASDAGQGVTNNRQAVDQSGSCSLASSGVTAVYAGDDPGSPPSSCVSPGQYFATQVNVSSPSSVLSYFGYTVDVRCGTTTIFIRVFSDLPGAITQQTTDGYLSSAIGKLDSASS